MLLLAFFSQALLGIATASSVAIELGNGFTVEGEEGQAFTDSNPVESTEHVVPLARAHGRSMSSQYLQLLAGTHPEDVVKKGFGKSPVHGLFDGEIFYTPIEYAGQESFTVIDTGSSNIWVAEEGFQCVSHNGKNMSESTCAFGSSLYTRSNTFEPIQGLNFNSSYLDGEFLNGVPGHETVKLAGITVPKQTIGAVSKAFWIGDGHSSGLTGLSFPALSSLYKGKDFAKDKVHNKDRVEYSPIFTTAHRRGLIKPVFSLACPRGKRTGELSFGGVPQRYANKTFAVTKIQKVNILHYGTHRYTFYTITPEGFIVQGADDTKFDTVKWLNPFNSKPVGWKALDAEKAAQHNVVPTDFAAIVDSGTSLNYVPKKIVDKINAAYSPPAFIKDQTSFVDCNAKVPSVGIIIGGREIFFDKRDLKIPDGSMCLTGFQPPIHDGQSDQTTPPILGDPFLKNVLAVFDVGAEEMKFAQRPYMD